MQYYDNFAYIENNRAAILMPGNKVSFWHYDVSNKRQTPLQASQEMAVLQQKALAHVLFSNLAYQQQRYKLTH